MQRFPEGEKSSLTNRFTPGEEGAPLPLPSLPGWVMCAGEPPGPSHLFLLPITSSQPQEGEKGQRLDTGHMEINTLNL